jgi:hypothetical protein
MSVNILSGLRNLVDANDGFIRGHQVNKIRRRLRKVPDWIKSEQQIQIILQRAFPKLKTDLKQRKKAGRWARVIQLYFRSQKSYRETAEEMGEDRDTIHTLIRNIRRVASGKRANGGGARTRLVPQTKHQLEG